MRYLAQISEAPRRGNESFWTDAWTTEEWLFNEGKAVSSRRLLLRSRTMRALSPWLGFQTQPLAIDAWLDPMDTTVTWTYLVRFLVEMGPERIWVPCGNDAWVGWSPQQLTIRASRESWLWTLAEDIWDPASWSEHTGLEWWAEERLQHAVRMPWGISEQRAWPTGWEEWTLSAAPEDLTPLWLTLADRLGSRPLRVKWRQEAASDSETLLGLKARYITCDLSASGDGQWLKTLGQGPDPVHIRAQMVWTMPAWSQDWSTVLTLRRVQRGTRLEATYNPRQPMRLSAWRSLRRDRRRIPILQMRPLVLSVEPKDSWDRLVAEAQSHHRRDRLAQFLENAVWPAEGSSAPTRLRLPAAWRIRRWASQPGLWVIALGDGLEVHIEWPTPHHPGNVGVSIPGSAPLPMNSWVRHSGFKRLSRDRRYWATWVVQSLLPLLAKFPG